MTKLSNTVEFRFEAEMLGQYDVLVVGGGFPGVCAAVAASRSGAKVAIVEKDGTLGGQAAEVYTFGLDGFFDREGHMYAAGIPWEILQRTVKEGQSDPIWDSVDYESLAREGLKGEMEKFDPGADAWNATFLANITYINPNAFRYGLFQMVEEEKIDIYLESPISGVLLEGRKVEGVVAMGNYGHFALKAGLVVDTTPQALMAALAGKPYTYTELYMGTHPFVAGVKIEKLIDYMIEHPDDVELELTGKPERRVFEKMVRERVPFLIRGLSRIREKAMEDDPIYETTGYTRPGKDKSPIFHFFYDMDGCGSYWIHSNPVRVQMADDIKTLSEGIAYYRKQQWLTHKLFRDYVPGFEEAHLMDTHPHIARAFNTRGQEGEKGFTEFDIPWEHCQGGGEYYPDPVARVMGHPNMGQSPRGFQVPIRALIPKDLEGLLLVGKAACPTFHYHGTMATLGQAAGVIAALAARENSPLRELDVSRVQDELTRLGAVVR